MKGYLLASLVLFAACSSSPETNSVQAARPGQTAAVTKKTVVSLKPSSSLNSLSAILFKAIDSYSETKEGSEVVNYGAREDILTEMTMKDATHKIYCSRSAQNNGKDEFACDLTNLNSSKDETDAKSVPAHLLQALDDFAQKTSVGGQRITYGAREAAATELWTKPCAKESLACSVYLNSAGEQYNCTLTKN